MTLFVSTPYLSRRFVYLVTICVASVCPISDYFLSDGSWLIWIFFGCNRLANLPRSEQPMEQSIITPNAGRQNRSGSFRAKILPCPGRRLHRHGLDVFLYPQRSIPRKICTVQSDGGNANWSKGKRVRSDQALKFHSKEVTKLAKQHGIILQASAIYAHDVTPLTADTTDDHSVPYGTAYRAIPTPFTVRTIRIMDTRQISAVDALLHQRSLNAKALVHLRNYANEHILSRLTRHTTDHHRRSTTMDPRQISAVDALSHHRSSNKSI